MLFAKNAELRSDRLAPRPFAINATLAIARRHERCDSLAEKGIRSPDYRGFPYAAGCQQSFFELTATDDWLAQ